MRRGHGGLSLALLALFAHGCGAPDGKRSSAPAPLASASAKSAAPVPYETPARWSVHPTPTYNATSMRLADGSCLVAELGGQRWITRPHRDDPIDVPNDVIVEGDEPETEPQAVPEAFSVEPGRGCNGDGQPAAEKAPEPISGIVLLRGAYGFVGESGTIHVARSPLGRFVRRIQPPEPLIAARSTGGAVLAITATGRLFRWTEQAGYQRVETDGLHAIDLDVAPAGRAVVLTAPEAVFTTEDAGEHLARAQVPSIGAQRVKHEAGGPFLVEGVETTLAWDPREPPAFTKSAMRIQTPSSYVSIDAGRPARASMVREQRAVLDEDRYWEVWQEGGQLTLYRGKLDGHTSRVGTIPDANESQSVLFAAREQHLALLLIHWDEERSMELRTSHDSGATFSAGTDLVMSESSQPALAVSAEGAVLVTGACLRAPDMDAQSCQGKPLVLRPDAPLGEARTPTLEGSVAAPAFSPDGRRAYFLASPDGEDPLALFVSKDGGVSFEQRALRISHPDQKATFDLGADNAITVSERGTLGMVLSGRGDLSGPVYVTTDADGRHVQAAEPPSANSTLGGFGERVLAIAFPRRRYSSAPADEEEEPSPVSESLDGGLHWVKTAAPQVLRDGYYYRNGEIACGAAGCLVGDEVTRVGWGGKQREPLPFEPVEPDEPPKTLRTPIVCDPSPGSTWTRIEHPSAQGGFPDESDAARGRVAWMTTTLDPETGALSVVAAETPESGGEPRIVTRPLFGPLPKKEKWALSYHPQIEGVAAARMKLSPDLVDATWGSYEGKPIVGLEVAWENEEEGSTTHVVLKDAGKLERYALQQMPGRYSMLVVGTLSVSPKGIFIRGSDQDKMAYFADTAGKVHRFRFPESPVFPPGAGSLRLDDAVNVDGTYIADGLFSSGIATAPQTLILLRPPAPNSAPDTPWTSWARTLSPGSDSSRRQRYSRFNWTYQGGHLTVITTYVIPAAGYAESWLHRVQGDGTLTPPARAATPFDLGKAPRGCTAAEHKDLPRLRYITVRQGINEFAGTQHPVVVRGAGLGLSASSSPDAPDVVSLLTSGLVMRGAPGSACVDAFGARGVEGEWSQAALIAGDLAHGWIFRRAEPKPSPAKKNGKKPPPDQPEQPESPRDIEVRTVTCHYDTTVPLPSVFHDVYGPTSDTTPSRPKPKH